MNEASTGPSEYIACLIASGSVNWTISSAHIYSTLQNFDPYKKWYYKKLTWAMISLKFNFNSKSSALIFI